MQSRRVYTYLFLTIGLLCMGSCRNLIYDDLSKCPQGVYFHFYSQTLCADKPAYPAGIDRVRIFVFDDKNILVEQYSAENIRLSSDYAFKTDFYKIGTFTFVVWGGASDDSYAFTSFKKGVTTKDQLFVTLRREADKVTALPHALFWGVSAPLTIKDRSTIGSVFDDVHINMQEITNRVNFTVKGLTKNEQYTIHITDDNGRYDFSGNIAPDMRFNYVSSFISEGNFLKARFVLMKLARNRNARLIVTNTRTGKEVYSVNLVEGLIMNTSQGQPPYKLECDRDFDIELTLKDISAETYAIIKATVNDWTVIYNPVILN